MKKVISDLFDVQSGDFHSTTDLDHGNIPLISCGETDNGLVGYFDVEPLFRGRDCITVAYNGSWPLLAKYHPYEFAAKDDVAVLLPKAPLLPSTLLYVAAQLNAQTWRYSYRRECFRIKLLKFPLMLPSEDGQSIDEQAIARVMPKELAKFLPKRMDYHLRLTQVKRWGSFPITEFFAIKQGDFHSIAVLDSGSLPTVSRTATNNGVIGYYEQPNDAAVYPRGSITVSTVGSDAFVQLEAFIATDNILVLTPHRSLALTTVLFGAMMLNLQKWRYSYGRQCYIAKFKSATRIHLPISASGNLDETLIESIVSNSVYWPLVSKALCE